jgi:hypothetical protein
MPQAPAADSTGLQWAVPRHLRTVATPLPDAASENRIRTSTLGMRTIAMFATTVPAAAGASTLPHRMRTVDGWLPLERCATRIDNSGSALADAVVLIHPSVVENLAGAGRRT